MEEVFVVYDGVTYGTKDDIGIILELIHKILEALIVWPSYQMDVKNKEGSIEVYYDEDFENPIEMDEIQYLEVFKNSQEILKCSGIEDPKPSIDWNYWWVKTLKE